VDGNAYAFLVNAMGVAVNGFPTHPAHPAKHIFFNNVHVDSLGAFINEVVALNQDGKAVIDPAGAVFQIRNLNADTADPLTVSSLEESEAYYVGNAVSNAQAFVAKAYLNGDFTGSHMDLSRMTITKEILRWVEAVDGYETLDSIVPPKNGYFCNGDSMFHVNKGVIGFKMDAARGVFLRHTSVNNVANRGDMGTDVCGDYSGGKSHPGATLPGYGGAGARGYTFAGSRHVFLSGSAVSGLTAARGAAIGVDILTDSEHVHVRRMQAGDIVAGTGGPDIQYDGPNEIPRSIGFHIGQTVDNVHLKQICGKHLAGVGGEAIADDESGSASVRRVCAAKK
jgi:hypothetical protein